MIVRPGYNPLKRLNSGTLQAAVLFLLMAIAAAASGAQTLRVEGLEFERVLVFGSAQVEVSQGDEPLLLMQGREEDLQKQPFFVKGDVLVLGRTQKGARRDFKGLKFKLTVRDLSQVELKGSGEIYVKPLQVRDFFASVDGSGDIKLFEVVGRDIKIHLGGSGDIQAVRVEAETLRVVLSGSGDIALGDFSARELELTLNGSGDISLNESGSADIAEINLVGSGDIDLEGLSVDGAEVNIMGSGDIDLGDVLSLEANILGSGDVTYMGNPEIEQSTLGSGSLRRRD